MYTANRSGLRGLYQARSQDMYGTNVRMVPMMFGETNTGCWDANPGSRQFVPWISNFIPNLSTDYCAEKILLAAALGKNRLMIYNWQVALLIWANNMFPSLMLFSMRLFRKPLPPAPAAAAAAEVARTTETGESDSADAHQARQET